jgi:hypothetical protein
MKLNRSDFLAVLGAAVASPGIAADAETGDDTIAQAAVVSSLDAIWTTLIDVGADPFLTSKREDVERLYRSTRASITSPMTAESAWLAIAPVLGALNDGHVSLGFPDPLNAAPRRFPLHFALSPSDDLIVLRDRTQTIPSGSRIVSIDGIAAETYRDATLAAFGGQTVSLHRTRVSMAGAWTAVALFGDRSSHDVRYLDGSGAVREATVVSNSGSVSGAPKVVGAASANAHDPYSYSTIGGGRVGLIDYRSCEDLERFKTFLESTFAGIKANPIDALIIDVRNNGGGDSSLNDVLWTYVSAKPFKQFGGVVVKACDRLKREYGREKYSQIYSEAAWEAPSGTILRQDTDPASNLVMPGSLPNRYSGRVYLLISPQTFSSAMSCALAAKDYGLATIVGEETCEPVSSIGEIYTEITQSGLRAYLTTKVFLPPKPHAAGEGVTPDIVVATTPSDIAAHRDPVIERVLSML